MRDILQATTAVAALLVMLALLPVFTSACGESASADVGLRSAQPVMADSGDAGVITAAAKTGAAATRSGMPSKGLHDKAMAERNRLEATAAVVEVIGPTMEDQLEPVPPSAALTAPTDPSNAATTAAPTEAEGSTTLVLTEGQTPIQGVWGGDTDRLASFLLAICPRPGFTVSTLQLAEYYVYYCAQAGLRADLLWAQMIHETGYGAYGGDVRPEQNNYAGVGATGGGAPGISFATAEAGVMAHVAHMVAYVYQSSPVPWADTNADPRFDLVSPRGAAAILADLDGRWAVPGIGYGARIEDVVRAINSY